MKTVCYNCHRVLNGSRLDPDTDHRGICDRCPAPKQRLIEVLVFLFVLCSGVIVIPKLVMLLATVIGYR